MTALLQVVVVAWLPGAAAFRLPIADRDRRASLPAEERLFWAIAISVAASMAIVLALAAIDRYNFRRLLIADVLLTALMAAGARLDLRLGPSARRAGAAAAIPLVLALAAGWRFLPPSEYVIGGRDPGTYVNAGVQIAQRGTLVYRDPVVAAVPPFARDLFFPRDVNRAEYYIALRFMGFFVLDPETGATVSQFPHAYPASIAIGYALDGLTGARRVFTFWAVFGVVAVYLLGSRLLGRPAAAAAALLLTLNVVEVWFSRYPNADVVMQGLLFAALLANARAHVDDDAFFAPVAGALLALLLFLRFDAVVAIGSASAAIMLGFVTGQRVRWTFVAPLAAGSALCAWYLVGPMREYFARPRIFLTHLPAWEVAALVSAAAALLLVVAAGRKSVRVSNAVAAWLPPAISAVILVLAAYALWFRHPGGRLADYDAYGLRTFANFYVTVPAVVAAVIGFVLAARSRFWKDPAFFLTLAAFSCFFFYKLRIVPEHFWMARRFVALILPGTLLMVGAAALTGVRGRLLLTRAIRGPIGVVFIALLAVQYARAARPVVAHVEYEGIIPRIERLAGKIADDDLLIVESRDSGSDVHVLAPPLADIYARNVLVLSSAAPDKAIFAAFLEAARERYRRVLFLGGGGTDLLSSKWTVAPIDSDHFQIPEYDAPYNAYPRSVTLKDFDYSVYVFGPPARFDGDRVLDIGINDDLNVIRFHAKEKTEGRTIRWTQRQSFIVLDHLTAADRAIVLTMNDGGRPPAAPPADVTVLIGDRTLGVLRVGKGFADYDVSIPADLAAAAAASGEPVRVTIRTTTWNPETVLGTSDARDLGVMIDRVTVR